MRPPDPTDGEWRHYRLPWSQIDAEMVWIGRLCGRQGVDGLMVGSAPQLWSDGGMQGESSSVQAEPGKSIENRWWE